MAMTDEPHLILDKINLKPLLKAKDKFDKILNSSEDENDEIACLKF